MDQKQFVRVRRRLEQFAGEMIGPISRRDSRAHVATYLRGVAGLHPSVLIVDDSGFRKQGRMSPGVAHQYGGTLGKQGRMSPGVAHQYSGTLDKQGHMSPGVAHQYCGALGKQAVCRVEPAVSSALAKALIELRILGSATSAR